MDVNAGLPHWLTGRLACPTLWSMTPLSPAVFFFFQPSRLNFSLKSSLATLGHTVLPRSSTAVNACMIYLVLSLCSVNYSIYFYSSLWPPHLDQGHHEGWEHHENGDHSSCICVFTVLNTALYGGMLCTHNGPAQALCFGAGGYLSFLLWLPSI